MVWEDVYRLAIAATDRGGRDRGLWDRALAALDAHAPDVPEQFERTRRDLEEQKHQLEEQVPQLRRDDARRYTISEVVEQVLGRDDRLPADLMRQLSLLCFSGEVWRYNNVDGGWADLDHGLQVRVLEACRHGLERGSPSPIPGIGEFNTANFAEAQAFVTLGRDLPNADWLDGSLIERWLPIVVRTLRSGALDTVRTCAGVDRATTSRVLIEAVVEEPRSGEGHCFVFDLIPAELWPGEVGARHRRVRDG